MLNNSTILDSQILVFLGAGASQPLDKPMMGEFVKKVSALITDDSQKRMLAHLRKFRGDDLEAILGELDTIVDLDYASNVSGMVSHSGGATAFSFERGVAERLSLRIKHEIIREYRNVDAEKTLRIYEPLFNVLFPFVSKRSECLPIFTTNYDPAIEEFCRQKHGQYTLCDGFDYDPASRHTYWSRIGYSFRDYDALTRTRGAASVKRRTQACACRASCGGDIEGCSDSGGQEETV
jgi:hypothetical protein